MLQRYPRLCDERRGFTLLEVMITSVIALVLFGALYFALSAMLDHSNAARDAVERAGVTRAIFNRMNTDLNSSLTPIAGKPAASASEAEMAGMMATEATEDMTALPLGGGIVGTEEQLTIFTTRVPDLASVQGESSESAYPSDLTRITYWIIPGKGLARQETPWVTGDEYRTNSDPVTDKPDEEYVIAPEVVGLRFQYLDPTSRGWTNSWTGTELDADMKTPKGPPAAVKVTLTLQVPDPENRDQKIEKEFIQTIAIQTAPGTGVPETPMPAMTEPPATEPMQ